MALKDWEKTKHSLEWIIWRHTERTIQLSVKKEQTTNFPLSKIKSKNIWAVFTRHFDNEPRVRVFKTKSQALKFAKSYMRRN